MQFTSQDEDMIAAPGALPRLGLLDEVHNLPLPLVVHVSLALTETALVHAQLHLRA